jgi:hypothetical protein
MKLTMTVEIPDEFLKDVLTSICETPGVYGIAYWGNVEKVTQGRPDDYTEVDLAYDLEAGEEGNRNGRFTMGLQQVASGIAIILGGSPEKLALHQSNIGRVMAAVAANDAGQIDGEAADWIAQAAIFGKVIYG